MSEPDDEPEFQTALELRESGDGEEPVDVIEVDEGPEPDGEP